MNAQGFSKAVLGLQTAFLDNLALEAFFVLSGDDYFDWFLGGVPCGLNGFFEV